METLEVNRNRRILGHKEEMKAVKRRLESANANRDKFDIRNCETLLPTPREAFEGKSKTWGGDRLEDRGINACNRAAVLEIGRAHV